MDAKYKNRVRVFAELGVEDVDADCIQILPYFFIIWPKINVIIGYSTFDEWPILATVRVRSHILLLITFTSERLHNSSTLARRDIE